MNVWRNTLRAALTMIVFSIFFTALMAGVFNLTHKIVVENQRHAKLELIAQVLPQASYDNDLLQSAVTLSQVESKLLGNDGISQVYLAQKSGRIENIIIEVTALDGYGGKIKLLVGINRGGVVQAVRVLAHKETPGLGDYIEFPKNDWILQFNGKSLQHPHPNRWRVKKEGGAFDYMSGATITARAIVKAVQGALDFVKVRHQRFFGTAEHKFVSSIH